VGNVFEGQAWLVWLGSALVFVAIEAVTSDFTLLMLAFGALGGSAAAALGAPLLVQALVAAVLSIALLLTVRPWLKRRFTVSEQHLMGAAAQIGRSAVALDRVTPAGGRVKLSGETWSARTLNGSVEPGEEVIVDSIDGATAVVSRARVVGS
jgi:membrane protein implicated in regulation of membrane protease activity